MPKVKDATKELVGTQVGENGEIEEPTLRQELESIVNQANGALQERNRQDEIYKRCLGAIEFAEKMMKREEDNSSSD